jgi:outer membrane lipoprotein-sorting protein
MTTRTLHASILRTSRSVGPAAIVCLLTLGACNPPPPAQPDDAGVAQPPADTPEASDAELSQDDLPPAEEVLDDAVAAIGGRDVIDSIESYYSESKMEIPAQNMEASTKIWWKKGNFYSETEMEGIGTTRMWRNEEGVTSDDPINGRRVLEGKEALQAEWSSTLSLVADWKQFFASAETKGRRKLDDVTLVDVVLTTEAGDEITLSFDAESGLLRQQLFEQESPAGVIPITVDIEDYTTFGGLKQPARSVMNMAVIDAVTTMVSFETNVEIDDAKFRPEDPKDAKAKKGAAKK